jgi:hypothetical protein
MRLPHCFICGEQDILLSHLSECHFSQCASKAQTERTFLRGDQLAQHIKGVHWLDKDKKRAVPKDLVAAWKTDNPELVPSSLHCGFCGRRFDSWSQRQNHVYAHLQQGICKAAWWPERIGPNDTQATRYVVHEAIPGYMQLTIHQCPMFYLLCL